MPNATCSHHFKVPSRFKRKKIRKPYAKMRGFLGKKQVKLPKINENKVKKKRSSKKRRNSEFICVNQMTLPLFADKSAQKQTFKVVSFHDSSKEGPRKLYRYRSKSAITTRREEKVHSKVIQEKTESETISIARRMSLNQSRDQPTKKARSWIPKDRVKIRPRLRKPSTKVVKREMSLTEIREKDRLLDLCLSGEINLIECLYDWPSWMCLDVLNDKKMVEYVQSHSNTFINACDPITHDTPLHVCVYNGQGHSGAKKIAYRLIHMNVQINPMNRDGVTPLDWSILTGQFEMTRYLLKKGAKQGTIMFKDESMNYFEDNVPCHLKELLAQSR